MAILTNKQLVDECKRMAAYHSPVEKTWANIVGHLGRWGYVLGAQGEYYTKELAVKWGNQNRAGMDYNYFVNTCSVWFGQNVADCSGMIVEAFRVYKKTYADRTANNFKAQFVRSGAIATIPEREGIAVWKSGHIGIYIGGGNVIEDRGVGYGIVVSKLTTQSWTYWGELLDVSYSDVNPYPTLRKGDKGAAVSDLQGRLNDYNNYGLVVDGNFGTRTEEAVKDFQKQNELKVDGICGSDTWAALLEKPVITPSLIVKENTNIRLEPSTDSPIVRVALKGEQLRRLNNGFYKVEEGWISARPDLTEPINGNV